jgi:hypothetical protein
VRLLDLFLTKSTHFSARLLLGKVFAHSLAIKGVIQLVTKGFADYAAKYKESMTVNLFESLPTIIPSIIILFSPTISFYV